MFNNFCIIFLVYDPYPTESAAVQDTEPPNMPEQIILNYPRRGITKIFHSVKIISIIFFYNRIDHKRWKQSC